MRPDLAIHRFMQKAVLGKLLVIFGKRTKSRDLTNIDNIVRVNILAMHRGSGACNIGGGYTITVQKLAEKIIAITGSRSTIVYGENLFGDAVCNAADTGKAEREL